MKGSPDNNYFEMQELHLMHTELARHPEFKEGYRQDYQPMHWLTYQPFLKGKEGQERTLYEWQLIEDYKTLIEQTAADKPKKETQHYTAMIRPKYNDGYSLN